MKRLLRKLKGKWRLWHTKPLSLTPAEVASQIDLIIYSTLPEAEMLERLASFIRLGDTVEIFKKRTGLHRLYYMGHGPGVMDYTSAECGLAFTADPDGVVVIIGRQEHIAGEMTYQQQSLSAPFFSRDGYSCVYDK